MRRHWAIAAIAAVVSIAPSGTAVGQQASLPSVKRTPISYAQLLAETAAFDNVGVRCVAIYTKRDDASPLALVGQTTTPPELPSSPAVRAAFETGKASESGSAASGFITTLPLLDATGERVGVLAIEYADGPSSEHDSPLAQSIAIRDYLRLIIPKRETLFDAYLKGFDSTDTLAQRINQTLLARHPDVNVIAIHLTAPGDTKNKVWGINRPNFIGRDSDEIDTDTEKTGRIVMQVIPATHRMEVHMPLLSPDGKVIGTICTVYLWKSLSDAADFYGRSLSIMQEVRQLTPIHREDLFRP